MELSVRTLRAGVMVLRDLDPGMDVDELKCMLSVGTTLAWRMRHALP